LITRGLAFIRRARLRGGGFLLSGASGARRAARTASSTGRRCLRSWRVGFEQSRCVHGELALHWRDVECRSPRRSRGRPARRTGIENRFRRFAACHRLGNGIGVLFVRIAWVADTIFELHAGALLHDVRRFVRREPEIR
jgi:hypothetical protein